MNVFSFFVYNLISFTMGFIVCRNDYIWKNHLIQIKDITFETVKMAIVKARVIFETLILIRERKDKARMTKRRIKKLMK